MAKVEHETMRRMRGVGPDFGDPKTEWRRVIAEAWGTALLVTASAGAAMGVQVSPDKITYGMSVVAPGLAVMVVIYTLGDVSGAHLNPAVTIAFALRRNFPWVRAPGYIVAQVAGAVAAGAFLCAMFGPLARLGATTPGLGIGDGKALAVEALLTTGLVNTILATAAGARNVGPNAAIAVGGYIALAGLWAGPWSGASMNPARSLAPDLLRGDLQHTWVYIVGPLVGALAAVALEWVLKGKPSVEGTRAAQGTRD